MKCPRLVHIELPAEDRGRQGGGIARSERLNRNVPSPAAVIASAPKLVLRIAYSPMTRDVSTASVWLSTADFLRAGESGRASLFGGLAVGLARLSDGRHSASALSG
uniref:Uncharacterized protein n=1 Tax=mine drainage metagenome TaxID=410659 RepID=E6Q2E4_9ZZZZ